MNKKRHPFSHLLSIFIAALLLALTGCTSTPLNHVGVFSQASAELAKSAADGYEMINNITIERRLSDIASEADRYPNEDTFKHLITGSSLTTRIRLLRAMETYANALGELASAQFRKEIDAASSNLYGALDQLQETYAKGTQASPPLTDHQLALIATAVDAIGTAIIEEKRRAALKTIIIQADPMIQQAMRLISMELPALSEYAIASKQTIFTDLIKAYQQEAASISYNERIMKLDQIRITYEEVEAISSLFADLITASKRIASAHSTLRLSVAANKFTSPELISEIKSLTAFAKSTQGFHDQLLPASY
ncbi:hypothetical protein SAMN05421880_13622 [Nitrosomonas nitrosa]|uniref:Uncharacterized protein n=1 Tax=Nitrosomonas nitrosa TaxID=52442 RepID=A0A1I4TZG3_9PROT|nr:hypothetical protein [Nitrosomonas nitrosa]SFM82027.1 hypothetical protein SAMN05421880_13622 [Nitrosomonas nitrosa]